MPGTLLFRYMFILVERYSKHQDKTESSHSPNHTTLQPELPRLRPDYIARRRPHLASVLRPQEPQGRGQDARRRKARRFKRQMVLSVSEETVALSMPACGTGTFEQQRALPEPPSESCRRYLVGKRMMVLPAHWDIGMAPITGVRRRPTGIRNRSTPKSALDQGRVKKAVGSPDIKVQIDDRVLKTQLSRTSVQVKGVCP